METERHMYQVPGRQLGWRVSQLQQQGIPYEVQALGGGVYIVVVQQPAGANPFAYEPVRRPRPGVALGPVLRWVGVMAAVIAVVAMLYMAWGRTESDASAAQPQPQQGGSWEWLSGLHLPWQSAKQPAEQQGFRWPWEAAADAVADVQGTVTTVSAAVLGVLVLLIVLALVRKR